MTNSPKRLYALDQHGVMSPIDRTAFKYSDGLEEEEYLTELLKNTADRSVLSPDLKKVRHSWATLYHLSSQRANLLRPVKELLEGKLVLELGAGCGALTRYMGETAKRVIALEGSAARSRIAALRCADLNNVLVFNDSIQNFAFSQKFDVVTLIGVLEYSRMYDESDCPELHILEIARSFLKPGGVLLLAIENRMGLKYFAGASEDHMNLPFFGIHNCYTQKTAVTFGRVELEDLLLRAGYGPLAQYVPLPDYKFPTSVVHPGALDGKKPNVDLTPFAVNSLLYDMQKTSPNAFSMEAVYGGVIANAMLRDMCNSFFFIVANSGGTIPVDETTLVSHYGGARLSNFAKETRFTRDDNHVCVSRERLAPAADSTINGMTIDIPAHEPYLPYPIFHAELISTLNTIGWSVDSVINWATPWIEYLRTLAKNNDTGGKLLPPSAIDMIPINFFRDHSGGLIPFDTEWKPEDGRPISLNFVVVRGLYNSLTSLLSVAPPADDSSLDITPLICRVLHANNLKVTMRELEAIVEDMCLFQQNATGHQINPHKYLHLKLFKRFFA